MKEIPKKELGTGRVAFKARMGEIKNEIERGRTVMSVYREFGNKVGIGYSQFDRYVNQFIRSKTTDKKTSVTPARNALQTKGKELPTNELLKVTEADKKEAF